VAFILVTAVGAFMDDKTLGKGFMSNPDLKPQFSSNTKFADVMGAPACAFVACPPARQLVLAASWPAGRQVQCRQGEWSTWPGSLQLLMPVVCRAHQTKAWTRPRLSWRRLSST
jgi:hypothetical protein